MMPGQHANACALCGQSMSATSATLLQTEMLADLADRPEPRRQMATPSSRAVPHHAQLANNLNLDDRNSWQIGQLQTERDAFESSWGQRCPELYRNFTEGGQRRLSVLLALPYSDSMPCTLREKMFSLLRSLGAFLCHLIFA